MQRKVELATVFLMRRLVKPLPIGFPTVRAYVINDMVKIDQPPREKACQCGRSGAVHGVTSQTDSSGSNDVSKSSHKFGFLCSIVSCAAETDYELKPKTSWLSHIYPRSAQILDLARKNNWRIALSLQRANLSIR
jgi:hypothetical protein